MAKFSEKGWFQLELSDEHAAALLQRGDPSSVGRRFSEFALEHGIVFPQGHLWLVCDIAVSNQKEVINKLKQWLDLFLAAGIRAAVLHPGGNELMKQKCEPKKILDARVNALNILTDYIKDTNLVLCLENTADEDLITIIESCNKPSSLGICLDTGHMNIVGGNQMSFIKKAGNYLKALHIADNDGSGDQHLMPFGRGTVPWKDVMSGLKQIHYEGLFNFEIPGEIHCPLSIRLTKLDYLKTIAHLMIDGDL